MLKTKPHYFFPTPQAPEPVVWIAGVTKDWMVNPQGLTSTKGWLNHNKNKTFLLGNKLPPPCDEWLKLL